VLTAIKNIAARSGYAPEGSGAAAGQLAKHGRLLEVTEFENEKRAELGLPPVDSRPEDYCRVLGREPGLAGGEEA
jgi:heterodisulfide reductase subunit C